MKKMMIIFIILLILFAMSCSSKEETKQKTTAIHRETISDSEVPTIILKKTSEKKPAIMIQEEQKELCNLRVENIPEDNEIDVYFDDKRIEVIPGYLVCDYTTNYLYKVLAVGEKEKSLPCSIKLPERTNDLIKFLEDNDLLKDDSERCLYGCMKGVSPGRCNPQPSSALKNIRGQPYIGR